MAQDRSFRFAKSLFDATASFRNACFRLNASSAISRLVNCEMRQTDPLSRSSQAKATIDACCSDENDGVCLLRGRSASKDSISFFTRISTRCIRRKSIVPNGLPTFSPYADLNNGALDSCSYDTIQLPRHQMIATWNSSPRLRLRASNHLTLHQWVVHTANSPIHGGSVGLLGQIIQVFVAIPSCGLPAYLTDRRTDLPKRCHRALNVTIRYWDGAENIKGATTP